MVTKTQACARCGGALIDARDPHEETMCVACGHRLYRGGVTTDTAVDHPPVFGRTRQDKEARRAEVRRLRESGMSFRAIGRELKISDTTVMNDLKPRDEPCAVEEPAVEEPVVEEPSVLERRRQTVYKLRLTGMSYREIGQIVGVTYQTVSDDIRLLERATASPRLDRATRQAKAVELRQQGMTYEAIGTALGVAGNTAMNDIRDTGNAHLRGGGAHAPGYSPAHALRRRWRQIAGLQAQGVPNRLIADYIGIALTTVRGTPQTEVPRTMIATPDTAWLDQRRDARVVTLKQRGLPFPTIASLTGLDRLQVVKVWMAHERRLAGA